MCGLGIYLSCKNENNYWEYRGAFDFYRVPLEEPYELAMVDDLDDAAIGRWKEGGHIVSGIQMYEKRGPLVAGYRRRSSGTSDKPRWFLFDCVTGQTDRFESREALSEACRSRGFDPPMRMRTIRENWTLYWQNPRRRRE